MPQALYLGIDVGTTKIAAVLVDGDGGVRAATSRAHEAALAAADGRAEGRVLHVKQLPASKDSEISILTRLEGRVLPAASPGGRIAAYFNPHPPRRTSATFE